MRRGVAVPLPSYEELAGRLSYDPETGALTWRHAPRSCFATHKGWRIFTVKFAGKPAGSLHGSGYVRIFLLGRSYLSHRLCWKLAYGEDCPADVDHRNRVRFDNRIGNLRQATRAENCRNRSLRYDNKAGHRGVAWHEAAAGWVAQIMCDGRRYHLGVFPTKDDAAAAYARAAADLFGEFSPFAEAA